MFVSVDFLPSVPVLMLRHRGSYEEMGPVFDKLWEWATSTGVPIKRAIGIYYDNPDHVPVNHLRSAACIEVPAGYQLGDTGGLPIEMGSIASGEYATTRFTGPYEKLEPVWTEFTNHVEIKLNRTISKNPAFEVYVNDPSDTPADQLITDLYMPVE